MELPYNPKNVLLTLDDVKSLLKTHGVEMPPKNINVYRRAFVHRSYCVRKNENIINGNKACPPNCIPLQEVSNETLEHLGDSVLGLVVTSYLKRRYPDKDEGFLTILRSKLVKGESLARFAETLDIAKFMLISSHIDANDGRNQTKLLEDTFEAFVGAIFEDFNSRTIKSEKLQGVGGIGYQIAEMWLINLLESTINFGKLIAEQENFKERLINYTQTHAKSPPVFKEKSRAKGGVQVVVQIGEDVVGCGEAPTKKQAEMQAAQSALRYFGV